MNTSESADRKPPVLALVAHDAKKDALTNSCVEHRQVLADRTLIATGTTSRRISEATRLPVQV